MQPFKPGKAFVPAGIARQQPIHAAQGPPSNETHSAPAPGSTLAAAASAPSSASSQQPVYAMPGSAYPGVGPVGGSGSTGYMQATSQAMAPAPVASQARPSYMTGGPPTSQAGPPMMGGPPTSQAGPPMMGGPPTSQAGGPPMMHTMPGQRPGPPRAGAPPSVQTSAPPPMMNPAMLASAPSNMLAAAPPASQLRQQSGAANSPNAAVSAGTPAANARPAAAGAPDAGQPKRQVNPALVPRPRFNTAVDPIYYRAGHIDQKQLPPSHTLEHVVEEYGQCTPRCMRATMNVLPRNAAVLKDCGIPMGVVAQPFARPHVGEDPIPLLDTGDMEPVRCSRCRAYLNPFVKLTHQGAKWTCNMCGMVNVFPTSYQPPVDYQGTLRIARSDRNISFPELQRGSIDLVAPESYLLRSAPQQPIFVFLVDVSYHAIASGALVTSLAGIRRALPTLPGGNRTRVGIVAYSDACYYFDFQSVDKDPVLTVMGDMDDPFCPLPDASWLANRDQFQEQLLMTCDRIQEFFHTSTTMQAAFGGALGSVVDGMKECGGRIVAFQSSLCSSGAGALSLRETVKAYGTAKELELLAPSPSDDWFKTLSATMKASQVTLDLHACGSHYLDLATQSQVVEATGGALHHYKHIDASSAAGESAQPGSRAHTRAALQRRLLEDRVASIGDQGIIFEPIVKVRASAGLRVGNVFGHVFDNSGTEAYCAGMDARSSFAFDLVHDGELRENQRAYVQCAVLYTGPEGQHRVRVHTLQFSATDKLSNVFRHADQDAVMNMALKKFATLTKTEGREAAKIHLHKLNVGILFSYRKHCAKTTEPAQLVLPESLKSVPVLSNALLKSVAFRENPGKDGADAKAGAPATQRRGSSTSNPFGDVRVRADERTAALRALQSMALEDTLRGLHPRLIPVHIFEDHDGEEYSYDTIDDPDRKLPITVTERRRIKLPEGSWPSSVNVDLTGVYVASSAFRTMIIVGDRVDDKIVQDLFGADSVAKLPESPMLPPPANAYAAKVHAVINDLQIDYAPVAPPLVVVMGGKLMRSLEAMLNEDQGLGEISYVQYLMQLHGEVRHKLASE